MRIALGIEYQGNGFKGWQRQCNVPSVQECIEKGLSLICNTDIDVVCAGRTDAGVHATNQVIHFDTPNERPLKAFTMGLNTHLPDTIAVKWAKQVDSEFHARFSATARRYRYVIYNSKTRPGILNKGLTHIHSELDTERMHQAAQALLGEQDFTSFRASLCQSNTPFRNVHEVTVTRHGTYVVVDIAANAFLHHMVRNIVGSLLLIGTLEKPIDWIEQLLALHDRNQAAATAKPNGLYLVDVTYPEGFGIPKAPMGPLFLA